VLKMVASGKNEEEVTKYAKGMYKLVKNGKYDPSLELKPKRSVYIHPFDALTYPIMYYDVRKSIVMSSPRSSVIEINA